MTPFAGSGEAGGELADGADGVAVEGAGAESETSTSISCAVRSMTALLIWAEATEGWGVAVEGGRGCLEGVEGRGAAVLRSRNS